MKCRLWQFQTEVRDSMSTDFLMKTQTATFSNAVKAIIGRSCLIEFGIIKRIIAGGSVVQVAVSVAKDASDTRILPCVLVSPCASSFAINIVPKVNDKVLVFLPRRFNADMFSTNQNDIITDANGEGFTPFTGLAILYNQFRGDYKNKLTVDNGDITVATEKASIHIDTSGNITVDAKSGKINIKNTATNLKTVLKDLSDTIKNLTTSGTAVAQEASFATQTAVTTWQTSELNALLN
jgi:hypothetical protein